MVKPTGAPRTALWSERDAVASALGRGSDLSAQSLPRVLGLVDQFYSFLERCSGIDSLGEVARAEAEAFIRSPTSDGTPSTATQHLRRTTLRLIFRVARDLGLADKDPTIDLALPPRSSLRTRPLGDDEVELCRMAALQTLTSTRLSAAWALAEASARTAELGHICVRDLDVGGARVWLHGSSRVVPRLAVLSNWGRIQLERRLRDIGESDLERPILYSGSGDDYRRQAAACVTIKDVLRRAGLVGEPDVRPLSVTAWVGRRVLAETGRIDEVARRLGFRSLDGAARLIDWDWSESADLEAGG